MWRFRSFLKVLEARRRQPAIVAAIGSELAALSGHVVLVLRITGLARMQHRLPAMKTKLRLRMVDNEINHLWQTRTAAILDQVL